MSESQKFTVGEKMKKTLLTLFILLTFLVSLQAAEKNVMYSDNPNIYDVDLPLICTYLGYWFHYGPDGAKREGK